MTRDIKKIISEMTLEEKAGLCSGLDFWHTKPVERLGIPSIMMTDGPHGLRKQLEDPEHLGLAGSVPSTCFPSGATLASSWDRVLVQRVGEALGEECQAEGVSIILGPAANIKRSPLCGRNFEYFSEDPYLSSEMAASHIKGVQSQNVGTSLKHFAANNQEHRRMSIDTIVDERTLREIYLASFEGAVKQSQPWTVMCAYNKINGQYCAENEYLLTSILKNEWGHEGFVMSDWGAVNDRPEGIKAGLELEMPSSGGVGDNKIIDAIKSGKLSEADLDKAVERLLKIIFRANASKKENSVYDKEVHHDLARKAARECMVLLKNEDNILPLRKDGKIAVIGALASKVRYQGGGSSHINPTRLDNALDELKKSGGSSCEVLFAEGYNLDKDDIDNELVEEAKRAAEKTDAAVIFAGLPDRYESEGYDRKHMGIPMNQINLIEEIAQVQSNIVIVLSNGSPIEMPWLNKVKGVLEAYLGGQAAGGALADLLFGDANPCGKLAETFPQKLAHNPSYTNFPGESNKVQYREGIFVGYRYYDKTEIQPMFPFGYGLSYTSFEYSDISTDKNEIADTDTLEIKVKVRNTGKVSGKEVVQLYVRDVESSVIRPEKELKAFEKLELQPGECNIVTFTLDKRAFAYYNVDIKDWHVETGEFELLVGASSKDILQKAVVKVNSSVALKRIYTRNSTIGDLLEHPFGVQMAQKVMKETFGLNPDSFNSSDSMGANFAEMMKDTALRAIVSFSRGAFSEEMLEGLLNELNR